MSKYPLVMLGDVCETSSGGTPRKENKEYYLNGTIPWIKTGDLKNKYISKSMPIEYITDVGFNNSSAKMFPESTVLVAMYGATIGACSILDFKACTNQACCALLPNEKLLPDYIYYYIKANYKYIVFLGQGGGQPNISATKIKKLLIPLPPLNVQKHIADTLDTASDLINLHKQSIIELDNLIQSTFINMFGDPVINDMGWDVKTVGEVAPSKQSDFTLNKSVWLLNLDCIESNTGHILEHKIIRSEELTTSTIKFDTNNVLYSKLRPYLNKVVLPKQSGCATSELVPLKPNKEFIISTYLLELLKSKSFVVTVSNKVSGAKMPRVVMNEFFKIEIPIPPLDLQEKFADIVSAIEEQKSISQQALDDATMLYNRLLQDFFE